MGADLVRFVSRNDQLTLACSSLDSEDPGLKQVKDWRHKLQKVFLGKTPPSAEVSFLVARSTLFVDSAPMRLDTEGRLASHSSTDCC